MFKILKYVVSFLLFQGAFLTIYSQMTVTTGLTGAQLVNSIVGPGYTISNIKMNCPTGASGSFLAGNSGIGIPSGILLTTGSANQAIGPNNNVSAGTNNGGSGDGDLDILSNIGNPPPPAPQIRTSDACAIEFDMIPACDTFSMRFMFGSEEYPEYVGTSFNDVFGFFISGSDIVNGSPGTINLAKVPGTSEIITVNSIHPAITNTHGTFPQKNQQYYVNNPQGGPNTNIQYDGYTLPITSSIKVTPCNLYHMKIAIADVDDGIFESGVFIESGSIQCSPVIYVDPICFPSMEGCSDGSFSFCRTGPTTSSQVIPITITGTATNGTDYVFIPDSIIVPAGQTCVLVNLISIDDPISDDKETVVIHYKRGSCPGMDSIILLINEPPPFEAGPDTVICSGTSVQIGVEPLNGYGYAWTPSAGLSNPTISNPTVTLTNNGTTPVIYTYSVSVTTPTGCTLRDTLRVTVRPAPIATFSLQGACALAPISVTDLSLGTGGATIQQWYWDLGKNQHMTVKKPILKYNNPGIHTITLTVTDNFGCTDDTSQTVLIDPLPDPDFLFINACEGDSISFINQSTVAAGDTFTSIWDFNVPPPYYSTNVKHLYPTSGKYDVQLIVTTNKGCINSVTKQVEVYDKPILDFYGDTACVNSPTRFYNTSQADYYTWYFGDGDSSSLRNPKHKYKTPGIKTVLLIGRTRYGCIDSISKNVFVNPKPVADFTLDADSGCAPLCINFRDNTEINGSDTIISWKWIFDTGELMGNGNQAHCFNNSGVFSPGLIVTSAGGCSDTVKKNTTITVHPKPKAAFGLSPSITTIYNATITFNDLSGERIRSWNFGDTKIDSTSGLPLVNHIYLEPGSYTITQIVENKYGCLDTITQTLRIDPETAVFVPNAFTPDDDGINDYFFPKVSGYLLEANFKMYIYDRWGNEVFVSNSLNKQWDGRANGGKDIAQQDVYNYIITFKDKTTYQELKRLTGSVTLVR